MRPESIWTYSRDVTAEPLDVQGFYVEATDGNIGKVDEATYEVGSSCVVVDTGPWIKESPEYDAGDDWCSPTYRERLGTYYGSYA